MKTMIIRLDRQSPIPLYHQIAEEIRYRVATGDLRPGDRLPSLTDAGALWHANLHTVRRAYLELAKTGVVETGRATGTRIATAGLGRTPAERQTAFQRFVWRLVREARERFQMSAAQLGEAILESATPRRSDIVTVVECTEGQASSYAHQVSERWKVVAEPWSLEWPGEPPPGRIVTTFFHYNDVRRAWPDRGTDFLFLSARPDLHLRRALERHARDDRLLDVVLFDAEDGRAHDVMADLISLFPNPPFRVTSRVVDDPAGMLRGETGTHTVFPPHVWSRLDVSDRGSLFAHQLRYVFESADLEALGRRLGWAAAHHTSSLTI